jgi:hypothetical protein
MVTRNKKHSAESMVRALKRLPNELLFRVFMFVPSSHIFPQIWDDPYFRLKWQRQNIQITIRGEYKYIREYCRGKLVKKQKYSNDILIESLSYVNNKLDGQLTTWYLSATMRSQKHYVDGILHGECKHWYQDGKLQIQENYSKGVLNGRRQEWYQNGQQKLDCQYNNGRLKCNYKQWYRNGSAMA